MATIGTILNLVQCGLTSVLGTGSTGCKQILKKATSIWITPDGFEFDSSETLDDTYAQLLQAQGNLIVLKGIQTFTDNSSEDQIETLDNGVKQVTTLGLYEFACTFINGLAFHAALTSLNSFGSYNILFVDRDGNILGTKATSGQLKGFSVGMLQGQRLMFPSDTTGQKEGIAFQFTERGELDTDYVYIDHSELGSFRPEKLEGINEVVLTYDSVPGDTDTTIVVNAKLKQNQQVWTGGLIGDFLFQVDGATVTPSGVVESPNGTYTATVSALSTNEVVTAALYDVANSRSVVDKGTDLYKSATITTTVTA